eukprot:m.29421 g.29421  ORF g.29421 m.29421 type:complete len:161 (+) comp40548_c0_seq1:87-569(+)
MAEQVRRTEPPAYVQPPADATPAIGKVSEQIWFEDTDTSSQEFDEDNVIAAELLSQHVQNHMLSSQTPFDKVVTMLRSVRTALPGCDPAAPRIPRQTLPAGGHHLLHPTEDSSALVKLDWCLDHLEEYMAQYVISTTTNDIVRFLSGFLHRFVRLSLCCA